MQYCTLQLCVWMLLSLAIEADSLSHDQSNCDSQTDIFVRAADTPDCNGKQPCHNLPQYLSKPQCYFTSNTTINFLPGIHLLEENITVSEVSNLTLVGSSQGFTATIWCSGAQVGLVFKYVTNLSILKLSFIHCGRIIPQYVVKYLWIELQKVFSQIQAALFMINVHTYFFFLS